MKKIEKGDYEYLQHKKIMQLLITLGCMLAIMAVILTGYIYYGNIKNTFTVIGVVGVIPAAKFMVSYIVMMPYRTPDKKMYDSLNKGNVKILSGLVITSTEKVMYVDFAAIKCKHVYCYVTHKKTDVQGLEKYLREELNKSFRGVAVKAFDDYDKFEEAVSRLNNMDNDKCDERIVQNVCIYVM